MGRSVGSHGLSALCNHIQSTSGHVHRPEKKPCAPWQAPASPPPAPTIPLPTLDLPVLALHGNGTPQHTVLVSGPGPQRPVSRRVGAVLFSSPAVFRVRVLPPGASALTTSRSLPPQFRRPESEVRTAAGPVPPEALEKGPSCRLLLWGLLAVLTCGRVPQPLPSHGSPVSAPCLCVFLGWEQQSLDLGPVSPVSLHPG